MQAKVYRTRRFESGFLSSLGVRSFRRRASNLVAFGVQDIRHIYRYISRFNPRAAEDLARELVAAGDSLESFPQRGRAVPGSDLREWTIVYPYIIRYRIACDHVRILRVRHGMRRR
jgi:toxin ParE1/3/4